MAQCEAAVAPGCPEVTAGDVSRGSCQALCERKVVSSRLPAQHPVPTCVVLPGLCSCTDAVPTLPQHGLHPAAAWEHSGANPGTARGTLQHPLLLHWPELHWEPWESQRVPEPAAATAVTQLLGCQLILGVHRPRVKLGSPSLAPLVPWERQLVCSAHPHLCCWQGCTEQGMSWTLNHCQTSQDAEPCSAQAAPAPSLPCPRCTQ